MSIITMTSKLPDGTWPEGAYCSLDWSRQSDCKTAFPEGVVMVERFVGQVLSVYERNGYDDSDFIASVWDPKAAAVEEITFASTRGWSYPNTATVDATSEVVAAAKEWSSEQQARHQRLEANRRAERLAALGVDEAGYKRLAGALRRPGDLARVERLLTTKSFRSQFRASLAAQVRTWLADKAPAFDAPLSYRQLDRA